ncbi:MAG: cytochrome B [Gammaproteobacteria bacterium]|nr:cytochrome B [Gammaproteobacteria bacterium]
MNTSSLRARKYPVGWRVVHWLVAVMVLTLIPVGLWMTARGEANVWGALTNALYSSHKAIGFTVLLLMLMRIAMKIRLGTPSYPDTMPRRLAQAATGLHHLLYLLLVLAPLSGWAGVTAYPALVTLGGYDLPAMPFVPQNRELAEQLFGVHGALAITLAVLIVGHIGAAVRHMLRKDGIVRRML